MRNPQAGESEGDRASGWGPTLLPALFAGSYLLLVIVVWTLSNNDPIYTRFLFPCYPFLILAGSFGCHRLRRLGAMSQAWGALGVVLVLAVMAANLLRWTDAW